MIHELTASEAVYGFASWLTCRNETIAIGASENASPVANLVSRFVVENNLKQPRENWTDNLKHPPAIINLFEYNNYLGSFRIDPLARCLTGKIERINDLIMFEGSDFNELEENFKIAVDDYLELCKEREAL